MKERKTVKIDADNLSDIEEQIRKEGNFKSKAQFVNEAVKEKMKKIREEQNKSSMEIIEKVFREKREYYHEKGIKDFEEFIKKIVINDNTSEEIEKIKNEKNSRIDKQNQKIKELERSIQFLLDTQDSGVKWKLMSPEEVKKRDKGLKDGTIKDRTKEDLDNIKKSLK